MDELKRNIMIWAKNHKKELMAASVTIIGFCLIVFGINKREELLELFKSFEEKDEFDSNNAHQSLELANDYEQSFEYAEPIKKYKFQQHSFEVSQHIRNLSGSQMHSKEKANEAKELGVELLPNQTIVDSYVKYKSYIN